MRGCWLLGAEMLVRDTSDIDGGFSALLLVSDKGLERVSGVNPSQETFWNEMAEDVRRRMGERTLRADDWAVALAEAAGSYTTLEHVSDKDSDFDQVFEASLRELGASRGTFVIPRSQGEVDRSGT
jgi:hypothetical protein